MRRWNGWGDEATVVETCRAMARGFLPNWSALAGLADAESGAGAGRVPPHVWRIIR